ncbi:hypothetical protein CEP53_009189 [Fusarium sp. AF-6]|nr:hypothetical protein CEP53_009189 [Fusarium sp. AF-6]
MGIGCCSYGLVASSLLKQSSFNRSDSRSSLVSFISLSLPLQPPVECWFGCLLTPCGQRQPAVSSAKFRRAANADTMGIR